MIKKLTYSVTFPSNGVALSGDLSLEPGSTAFIGPNGSGKTFGSIELIRYLLFGKRALRGPASDYKTLKAEGVVEIAGKEYCIERHPSKETLRGPEGEVLAVNTEAVNQKLLEILGFGLDVFDVVCAARQKDSERLSQMKAPERKRLIDRILGLTAQERAEKDCRDEAKGHRKLADLLAESATKPEAPEKPIGYRPVAAIEADLAYEKERARLEAIVARAGEEPPVPVEPCLDVADLENRMEEFRSAEQRQQMLVTELEKIPLPVYTIEQIETSEQYSVFRTELDRRGAKPTVPLEQIERMRHVWYQLQAVDGDSVICPKCEHEFTPGRPEGLVEPELTLSQLKAEEQAHQRWNTPLEEIPRPAVVLAPDEVMQQRLAHSQVHRRRELEDETARYVKPDDVSEELARAKEEAHRYALQCAERQRWETASSVREELADLKPPAATVEELSQALIDARVYERLLSAYETHRATWDETQQKVEEAKAKAKAYTDGATALSEARTLVKAYLAPSLSRVATSLIHQMTNGVLTSVEVDEDMNIVVDGQDISTLSGAGATVANLAVRIGLGRVLVNRVFPVFIGDEIDSDMDAERAEATAEALASLTDQIQQILIITHKQFDHADRIVIHPLA